jgi:hypothetical protein
MGGYRKLHNEELHKLCSSSNINRVTKLRRMRCVGHTACRGEIRNAYKILVRKYKTKKHLRDLGIDGRIILKRILNK